LLPTEKPKKKTTGWGDEVSYRSDWSFEARWLEVDDGWDADGGAALSVVLRRAAEIRKVPRGARSVGRGVARFEKSA